MRQLGKEFVLSLSFIVSADGLINERNELNLFLYLMDILKDAEDFSARVL